MDLNQYLESVTTRFKSGISREHAYRSDLEQLIRGIAPNVELTNEPSKVTDCGNPDFVITKREIPIGFIEAKDVNKDLNSKVYKEQFTRYKNALDNLIITDYLWFQFFQEGELVHEIRLAEIVEGDVITKPDQFEHFSNLIKDFCTYIAQTIKSSKKLAEMMAGKARLLQNVIEQAVTHDEKEEHISAEDSWLINQYKIFKDMLIHDLQPKGFADIYAQTVAYGMFAARLHDETLNNFSRQEAAELIPKSNPFLRRLFGEIAGPNIDQRIRKIVDNLAEVFRATNVDALLKNFGKSTQTHDPIIHFYETFLAAYDPKLRKARGVWYTPEPVVNFIVRAVDDVLKTEFGLKDGLADTTKTTIQVPTQTLNKRTGKYVMADKEVHKVQILDPAAGTGTFLAEVVKFIHEKKFKAMQGAWSQYVDEHLIPRLNGFELLMASYAMAHLKLDLLLTETGYKPQKDQRLNIYLTNSLEEYHPDTGGIFSQWLSDEAREANHIKRDTPVMCVIGNPPYSGESANKGEWIMNLMEDYKKEPGGKEKLKERNPKWINDDYVKFMRYGQHFIEKNGEGILAFINPHGFLDNPTFRGMRWNLLKTYDKIYTIDLHGNSKKKETCPDGSKDENVFDIMQGVSINIMVKTGKKEKNELAEVFHFDLYGLRKSKYQYLWGCNLNDIKFVSLPNKKPAYFMVQKDFELESVYQEGVSINDLFLITNVGIVTSRDALVTDSSKNELKSRMIDFFNLETDELISKYKIKENKTWSIISAKQNAKEFEGKLIQKVQYRPFDIKYLYYSNHFVERSRQDVMEHMLNIEQIGLVYKLGNSELNSAPIHVTNNLIDFRSWSRPGMQGGDYIAPLYLEADKQNKLIDNQYSEPIKTNLNLDIVNQFASRLKLEFLPEEPNSGNVCMAQNPEVSNAYRTYFTPINLLDYIYSVLYSPSYREKYKEFLKIDFPRVPYPKDKETFWKLVELGGQIRELHLMENPKCEDYITTYPIEGDHLVSRKMTKTSIGFEPNKDDSSLGKVWINDKQYFDGVPELAWNFYIGGYQPAQKWLKDRQGRNLSFDDILHYQKIIVILTETDRLMNEIDQIEFE